MRLAIRVVQLNIVIAQQDATIQRLRQLLRQVGIDDNAK